MSHIRYLKSGISYVIDATKFHKFVAPLGNHGRRRLGKTLRKFRNDCTNTSEVWATKNKSRSIRRQN